MYILGDFFLSNMGGKVIGLLNTVESAKNAACKMQIIGFRTVQTENRQ